MNVNARVSQAWWERLRWTRHGFFAGLILGIVMGWLFHGVISFIFRFGLVLLLLLPLLVIGWLWLRSSRGGQPGDPAGNDRQVVTWSSHRMTATERFEPTGPIVDVPTGPVRRTEPRETQGREGPASRTSAGGSIPTDVERELQELKRQQERGR